MPALPTTEPSLLPLQRVAGQPYDLPIRPSSPLLSESEDAAL